MQWDIFCRVVDNLGDIGVCWRLAVDLAARADEVRLWTDDASALSWMAPQGAAGIEVRAWPADADASVAPHECVIEAFGCHLPVGFVERMAARHLPPVWINLEYLSAEDHAERNHGLPSPQASGPARGLPKWFFYPGFTSGTGGLLREADLAKRQATFDPTAWRRMNAISPLSGERCASLFCYSNPALPGLLEELSQAPTLLLVTSGHAARQVRQLCGTMTFRATLRLQYLPALSQVDYDHLLWSCDLNFVRGEDSFVRAQWAAKPFLWQIYPQDDGAHAPKLEAFHRRFLSRASASLGTAFARGSLRWNGLGDPGTALLPPADQWDDWKAHCEHWRAELVALPDLTSALRAFALERR